MQPPHPPMASIQSGTHSPDYIDNAKYLTASMIKAPNRRPDETAEPSGRSSPFPEDREPLLGHPSNRSPADPDVNPTAESDRRRTCWFGLPIIVFCRLFNTVFAACTIYKANTDVGDGWNIRIHKLLFDFCWIILVWNIFALVASIVSCVFFPSPDRRSGEPAKDFRDRLRVQFACNDVVLGIVTLVLLVIACHGMRPQWEGRFVGLMPPVVAMVSSLVTVEFLIAMVQPFRVSERMLCSIN
ncbi:hypothetical protein F5Y04DRAFT_99593 [Hypomontagnella monticulosa]|nr:hypothetical protein F5Y04DRAFT_99593 [Hypomontagnella monticulosa]